MTIYGLREPGFESPTRVKKILFLISNFRRVLNVVYFLLGNSPASEFRRWGNYPEESIQKSFSSRKRAGPVLRPTSLIARSFRRGAKRPGHDTDPPPSGPQLYDYCRIRLYGLSESNAESRKGYGHAFKRIVFCHHEACSFAGHKAGHLTLKPPMPMAISCYGGTIETSRQQPGHDADDYSPKAAANWHVLSLHVIEAGCVHVLLPTAGLVPDMAILP